MAAESKMTSPLALATLFTLLTVLDSTMPQELSAPPGEANCRNAVEKAADHQSVYKCEWDLALEKHLFEIVSDSEAQEKYIEDERKRFPVVSIEANITDEMLDETSFDRLTDQQTSKVHLIILNASNLQNITGKAFSRFTQLKSLQLRNTQALSSMTLQQTFCGLQNLASVSIPVSNISCSCRLFKAYESMQRCSKEIDFDFKCVNDSELLPISNFCVEEGFLETEEESDVNWTTNNAGKEHHVKQASQATFVLIIILSCVLLAVIVFAVVLFLSHHYCRNKSSKKTLNHPIASGGKDTVAGADKDSHNICGPPPTNPKQVKFRPLSREYQSIDGCPFDTQIPIASPAHENKPKNVIPYSTPEQKESENWSNSGEEFVC